MDLVRRDACQTGNDYNGMLGARISSVFVILVGGSFGSLFPIVSQRYSGVRIPWYYFFIAKYFGSGVIVATSLIHLLQPANEALTDPCLGEGWQAYPYAFGIALFVIFLTFFLEIISRSYLNHHDIGGGHNHGSTGLVDEESHHDDVSNLVASTSNTSHFHRVDSTETDEDSDSDSENNGRGIADPPCLHCHVKETESSGSIYTHFNGERKDIMSQLASILFLEFGIIFHSVFIGLTLAVSGEEFKTLYIVLVFHQTFEGLGLGTRLASAPWPNSKGWVPWALGLAFGFTTPIAIAIGLGVRETYPPNSQRALITNGIFDSISAGILLYTGLVELVSNEFLHSHEFKHASTSRILFAFFSMCWGAGLMALLGKWA